MTGVDELIGRQLGDYVVRERIGEGGFGAVYRAQQAALSREAVIKVLRFRTHADDGVLRRFTAEAQVASRLDHPYAAHIYGFGAELDGLLWIAMELVRGVPFDVMLSVQGPIKLDRFVPFFERVCEVVHTAHEQGIVHRDLKPANIMVLSRAGRLLPKLLDFGIAKVLSTALSPEHAGLATTLPLPMDTVRDLGATTPIEAAPNTDSPPIVAVANPANTGNEILGSPRYMAPEQWASAKDVDARTDIYALAAVAYEALAGKPAFDGATVAQVMQAHWGPIPKLPPGFPKILDDVLARALAKQQGDRYASAIELAEAVRAAAGLKTDRGLPQLDRKIRTRFVERAPEPIADAIVALQNAENVHAARDALSHVGRSLARWLGLLAMSCRSRTGAGDAADSMSVQERLRTLRREGLKDTGWLELARDLVRPFAGKREAHPIPELVNALFPTGDEVDAGGLLERMLELQATTDPSEGQLRARFPDLIKQLGDVLAALSFVTDYDVVVPRAGRVEKFVGSRRIPRVTMPGVQLADHDGRPVLLDADGAPVLVLWPLVQSESPAPGSDHELFLLDGPARSGARLVAPRQAFEIHDATMWEWFHRTLLADDERATAGVLEEKPYRGLAAFTEADAHLFYGREREVDAFVNRLRVTPLLAVIGPSGAGKSSFVQAGALTSLGWASIVMRPGAAPLSVLAARLGRPDVTAKRLQERPELLGEVLRAQVRSTVLVIDQLEELFTLCSDAAEREQFGRAIALVALTADDPVRVIVTLRDDFLMRAENLPAFRERLSAGLHLLGTPKRDDLMRIVVEPARRAGYELEDNRLAEEMVDAVSDRPGALALLSFTAAQLWELRDRHFRHLPRKAYQAIGGVGGALAGHAEETLARMPPDQRALVREAFRRLVTAEGTRAVLTRTELVQVLGGSRKAEDVIETLVASRLLAASEAELGEHIEVTHEALLSAWPRLVQWRREDADGARLRDQLRAAARQWDERGRPSGLLWRGDALAEFQIWRGRTPGNLTEVEDAFTSAALRDAARGRRARRGLVAAGFGFLIFALVGALWLNARTKAERGRAVQSLLDLYEEQGRVELLAGHPGRSLIYLAEARRLGARGAGIDVMIAAAARPLEAVRLSLAGHTDQIWSAAYSHDGRHLVTASADRTARVWNGDTGRLEATLIGHEQTVFTATFSRDDSRIATAGWDGTARIWDARDGRLLVTVPLANDVYAAELGPDGTRLATATGIGDADGGGSGTAQIWDANTGTEVASLAVAGYTRNIAWSHDGTRVVTASGKGIAQIWNARDGAPIATLAGHDALVVRAVFSADDKLIATASRDGSTIVWDAGTGAQRWILAGHTDQVVDVEFSPDGASVVTASFDNTARIWDTSTGRLRAVLVGHDGPVSRARYSPRGDWILTVGDNTARLWDAGTGALLAVRDGHANTLIDGAFHPDQTRIATASWDHTARVWDASPDFLVASTTTEPASETLDVSPDGHVLVAGKTATMIWTPELGAPAQTVSSQGVAAFRPGGTSLAVAGPGHAIEVRRIEDGGLVRRLEGHRDRVLNMQFSRDGARLASVAADATVRIWDVEGERASVVLENLPVPPLYASFSPDGGALLTTGSDGVTRVWDARTGRAERPFPAAPGWVYMASFGPGGHRVAMTHGSTASIWDADTRVLLGELVGHRAVVHSVRFSPDGALVGTSSRDRTVGVWDVERRKLLLKLQGHDDPVTDVRFTRDGEVLVSYSAEGVIHRWRVPRDRRSPAATSALARCRVPMRLDATGLTPAPVDCEPD